MKTDYINLKSYDVVIRHVVSENSTSLYSQNKYSFRVALWADKNDIKEAVENMFGVKVKKVNTLIRKGKNRIFKGHLATLSDWKKAIVTLEEGSSIDVAIGGES